jgi:putative glutamine amidotransferase
MSKDRSKDRPLIGINADFYLPTKGRSAYSAVHSGYYDSILTAGGLPVVIPPMTKEQDLAPILDRLDGVVLTEGDDMDPRKMGLGPHPTIRPIHERREQCDRVLCKLVQQRAMPLLGVGLGFQQMTVCYGGGIYQHLPEDLPKGIPHRDPQGGMHRHAVTMVKKSLLMKIYGEGEIPVTSYHHQGLRKLPTGFRASAMAPDGLVEAIEWKDDNWFAIGVQWHPQNDGNISLDMQLIESFVAASAKYSGGSRVALPMLQLAKAG